MPEREQLKPELIEAKLETPVAKPATTETPQSDTRYFSDVSRYFNARREIGGVDEEQDMFIREQQQMLEKLANPKLIEQMRPNDVAIALSELSGVMSRANPNIESNRTSDPESDAFNEKMYLQTKRLFMESSKKMFPDTKVDIHSDSLKTIAQRLEKSFGAFSMPEITDAEVAQLLKDDPKKLAEWIDRALYLAGDAAENKALVNFGIREEEGKKGKIDSARYDEENNTLANITEAIYKLQLLRDQLQQEIYGRADIPSSDVRKIDALRDEFKDSKPEAKDSVAEKKQRTEKPKPKESPELEEIALRDKKYDLGKDGPFKALYAEHKTPVEVKKAVTPEMKRLFLEKMLRDIDMGIRGAEEFVRKNPSVLVNRKEVAQFSGIGVTSGEAAIYQKIAVATEGRIISPGEIAQMPIADYLKRYLGYDLRTDKKRAELLEKFTNALS